jgi:hypothetical protein
VYNRYIRSADGVYTRVPQRDDPPPRQEPPPHSDAPHAPRPDPPPPHPDFSPPPHRKGSPPEEPESDFISRLLGKFHLEDVDSGDLLILLLLFFLFRQDADEELLVALGLLLIL